MEKKLKKGVKEGMIAGSSPCLWCWDCVLRVWVSEEKTFGVPHLSSLTYNCQDQLTLTMETNQRPPRKETRYADRVLLPRPPNGQKWQYMQCIEFKLVLQSPMLSSHVEQSCPSNVVDSNSHFYHADGTMDWGEAVIYLMTSLTPLSLICPEILQLTCMFGLAFLFLFLFLFCFVRIDLDPKIDIVSF